MSSQSWRELEVLVAKIQAQLAPDATIQHNVRLAGMLSGVPRQVDVLVTQKIGQYTMRIVLDCKDYAEPVDVKGVEEFHGLVDDVGAHKGALVCPRGFTPAAKTRAAAYRLDLYSPVDTDPHKWQAQVSVPVVCDFRSAAISFGLKSSARGPFMLKNGFLEGDAQDNDGKSLGSPYNAAINKWNAGGFPTKVGEHRDLNIFDTPEVLIDNGYGRPTPGHLYVGLLVRQELYFGELPITEMSGFKDELSGEIITNAFTLGLLNPQEVEQTWQKIQTMKDAPARPLLTLRGLVGWAADSEPTY